MPSRSAHGGLSLAEMVVPGALLQRIVEKKVAIVLEDVPAEVHGREGEPLTFNLALRNRGNQPGRFRLSIRCSTDRTPQIISESLAPGEQRSLAVRLGPPAGAPAYAELLFSHQDLQGNWLPDRRTDISLHIERRTDVVELQFGGLDDLDAL